MIFPFVHVVRRDNVAVLCLVALPQVKLVSCAMTAVVGKIRGVLSDATASNQCCTDVID